MLSRLLRCFLNRNCCNASEGNCLLANLPEGFRSSCFAANHLPRAARTTIGQKRFASGVPTAASNVPYLNNRQNLEVPTVVDWSSRQLFKCRSQLRVLSCFRKPYTEPTTVRYLSNTGFRKYHATPPCCELDVIKYLSASHKNDTTDQEQAIFHKVDVVEFSKDGAVLETEILLEDLKLHPRDMLLFTNTYFSPQRAVIAIRDGMILFRTELVRSIIFANKAYLFPCKRKRETVEVAQTLYSSVSGVNSSTTPFEVKVLEALLAETTRFFDLRSRRLSVVASTVAGDIDMSLNSKHPGIGDLQRLIPIQNKLTEMYQDVKETIEDIVDLMNSTESLASACLSERKAKRVWTWDSKANDSFTLGMQKLASVLERYEYQLRAVEGVLKEIEERLDNAKVVWQMQLDSMRNRIIKVNLAISLSSFSLMVASVPAAFFGMNLPHGLEDSTTAFYVVLSSCLVCGALTFWGTVAYFFLWPQRQERAKMRDMQSLHDLLMYHIDDLDDILAALRQWEGRISKEDFYKLVRLNSSRQKTMMSSHEIGLLYRMFDTNRVAFLQLSEMVRSAEGHPMAPRTNVSLRYPADDVQ